MGIHEDITERIHGEESMFRQATELARTNMRFDAALSNMSHGISMFDQDRRLVVWNQRYAEIYQLPPDLLAAGAHVNGVMADLVARGILKGDTDRQAIDKKIAAMDQYAIDSQRVEELSDGRLILISRQPMAGGGWVSTHEDITERVRREEALRQQATELARTNMRFDAALRTMTQGLCMFDDRKRLVVWNDRYAELYHVPPELLKVGTPYEAIVTDRIARGVLKGDTSALAVRTKVAELAQLADQFQQDR